MVLGAKKIVRSEYLTEWYEQSSNSQAKMNISTQMLIRQHPMISKSSIV